MARPIPPRIIVHVPPPAGPVIVPVVVPTPRAVAKGTPRVVPPPPAGRVVVPPPPANRVVVPPPPPAPPPAPECSRDENGNVIDDITQEIIPPNHIVTIRSGESVNCFDLDTLYKQYRLQPNGILRNPFTQQPVPREVLKRVQDYEQELMIPVTVVQKIEERRIDKSARVGEIVFDVIRLLERSWDDALFYDIKIGETSAYTLDFLTPLQEQVRINSPLTITIERQEGDEDLRVNKIYAYAIDTRQQGIADLFEQYIPVYLRVHRDE